MRDNLPHCEDFDPEKARGVIALIVVVGEKNDTGLKIMQGSMDLTDMVGAVRMLLSQIGELSVQVEKSTGLDVLELAEKLGPVKRGQEIGRGITPQAKRGRA